VKKFLLSFLVATFVVLAPTQAVAGGHASVNVNVRVNSYRGAYGGYGYGHRPYYPPYYGGRYFRPVCRVGGLSPGCFAPVRKTGFFLGVAGFRVARGAFFVGRAAVRGVAAVGRVALFGRRWH